MNAMKADTALDPREETGGHESYRRFLERVIADAKVGSALPELASEYSELGAVVLALAQENGSSRQIDLCVLAPANERVREQVVQRASQLLPPPSDAHLRDWEVAVRGGRDLLQAKESPILEAWAEMPIPHGPTSPVRSMLLLAAPSKELLERVRTAGESLAKELGIVMDAVERLNELSTRDPMTGLYNRRGLDEELRRIWSQCSRAGQPVSLLFLDIDNLRDINDTYGHLMGDQVIKEMAAIVKQTTRAQDVAARYGGDEMVVVLPATRSEDARIFSDRLLNDIRKAVFGQPKHHLHLSISIGISAAMPGAGEQSLEKLIEQGDHALLAAKRNGRDRFFIHTEAAMPSPTVEETTEEIQTPFKPGVGRILVVDDEHQVSSLLVRYLTMQGHEVSAASSAREAMEILHQSSRPFDLLITDINMPGESGFDLMGKVSAFDENIVMLVITGAATIESAVGSMRYGAFDYLQKPIDLSDLSTMVKRAIEYRHLKDEGIQYQARLESMVQFRDAQLKQAYKEIRQSYGYTLEALASLLDAREHNTGQHSIRVRDIALYLGSVMGMSDRELDLLNRGALLHDIGKIAMPDSILLKPGPLTPSEKALMQTHVDVGYRILSAIPYLADAARIVEAHHERFDGTGYTKGLKGTEIPLADRLFTVVDSYDAIRSPRPYHEGHSAEEAIQRIVSGAGKQFDPNIVEVFVRNQPQIEELGRWDSLPRVVINNSLPSAAI